MGNQREKVTDWHTVAADKSRDEDRVHPLSTREVAPRWHEMTAERATRKR